MKMASSLLQMKAVIFRFFSPARFLLKMTILFFAASLAETELLLGAPTIDYTPASFEFTGEVFCAISPQVLVVSNSGDTTLDYSIASDAIWLSLPDSTGSLEAGTHKEHTIYVNTRGRNARQYCGRLSITSPTAPNSPQEITTQLSLAASRSKSILLSWGQNNNGQTNAPLGLIDPIDLCAGESHSMALNSNGSVVAWGRNDYGETNVPSQLTNVVAITCGRCYSLALRDTGEVVAWGYNGHGETNPPPSLTNAASISAGGSSAVTFFYGGHSLALRSDGTVLAWGFSNLGQTNVPPTLSDVLEVSAGGNHSLALKNDGTVIAWGGYNYSQTNMPAGLTNIVAISAGGRHSLALRSDGSVVAWGDNSFGQTNVPSSLTNAVTISAGGLHSMALDAAGEISAWGNNSYGQTTAPTPLSTVLDLAAGYQHSMALCKALRLDLESPYGEATPSTGTSWFEPGQQVHCSIETPVSIGTTQYVCKGWTGTGSVPATGSSTSVTFSITSDSSIHWLWETNRWPKLQVDSFCDASTPPIGTYWYEPGAQVTCVASTAVANTTQYVCKGWTGSGSVPQTGLSNSTSFSIITNSSINWLWATNFWLELTPIGAGSFSTNSSWQTAESGLSVAAMPDPYNMFLGWKGDTNDCSINDMQILIPIDVPRLIQADFCELSLTSSLPSTALVAWGNNNYGQTNIPAGLSNIVAVAGGMSHSLALLADGTVRVWGDSSIGQTNVPSGLSNVVGIAGGDYHSLALQSNGTVVAWGSNSYGATNVPPELTNAVGIAAGGTHSLALTKNGSVIAWGQNTFGQTNVPPGLVDVVSVAAGAAYSAVLRADGSVLAWGGGTYGETNVPPDLTNTVAVAAGSVHSLALRKNETVVAWGDNTYHQTNMPPTLTNVLTIAAGAYHSVALRNNGTVVAWGRNHYAQTNVPPGLINVFGVAAGKNHNLALGPGVRLDVFSPHGSPYPVPGSTWHIYRMPLKCSVNPTETTGLTQYVCRGWTGMGDIPMIGTSNTVSVITRTNSSINWLWNTNYWLELGKVGAGTLSSTSAWHTATSNAIVTAMPDPGDVFLSWIGDTNGCTLDGPQIIAPMTAPRSVIANFSGRAAAVTPTTLGFTGLVFSALFPQSISVSNAGDGTLNYAITHDYWLSVSNETGLLPAGASTQCTVQASTRGLEPRRHQGSLQLTDPAGTNNPQVVSVMLYLTSAAPPTAVSAWGLNDDNQTDVPPGLTNVTAVAAGEFHSLALRSDGTVVAWGRNVTGQTNVPPGLTNVTSIDAGRSHSLALRSDGTIVAWGYNFSGQTNVPPDLTNTVTTGAGANSEFSLAVLSDGSVAAWGHNALGSTDVPSSLTNAVAVAAGGVHSVALRSDGTVIAWGSNIYGQTNVPPTLTNAVAIAAGRYHTLALRSDGTVVAWGYNYHGETNVPPGLTNVIVISAGEGHSLALQSDGTLTTWGLNTAGQTNAPPGLARIFSVAGGAEHSLAVGPASRLLVTSPFGSPTPAVGTTWHPYGSCVTCSSAPPIAMGTTQYICSGWTAIGSAPLFGTSNLFSFPITTNSSIDWLWDTNYWLNIEANNGTVNLTNGWVVRASNMEVVTSPWPYYHFDHWSGDTNTTIIESNTLELIMATPLTISAWCSANLATNNVPEWWLATHGLTNRSWDAEAMDDQDHDGLLTWQEYYADTYPTNVDSVLSFTDLTAEGNGLRIFWKGGVAVQQYLERREDLLSSNSQWQTIFTNSPPTTVSTNVLLLDVPPTQLYFRIRTQR